MRRVCSTWTVLCALMPTSLTVLAGESAPPDGLFNVSRTDLGATAKGSGATVQQGLAAEQGVGAGMGGGGTIFGAPLTGGRVDISLLIPLDIAALEVVPLDYHGTQQPKAIEIFVDGRLAKHVDLPETPGKPIRIPLTAHGQRVGILVTAAYPVRTRPAGKKGSNYGGWARLRVLSTTNLADRMRPVDGYAVEHREANIAPPPALRFRARWR